QGSFCGRRSPPIGSALLALCFGRQRPSEQYANGLAAAWRLGPQGAPMLKLQLQIGIQPQCDTKTKQKAQTSKQGFWKGPTSGSCSQSKPTRRAKGLLAEKKTPVVSRGG